MKILLLYVLLVSTTFTFGDARRPQTEDPDLANNPALYEYTSFEEYQPLIEQEPEEETAQNETTKVPRAAAETPRTFLAEEEQSPEPEAETQEPEEKVEKSQAETEEPQAETQEPEEEGEEPKEKVGEPEAETEEPEEKVVEPQAETEEPQAETQEPEEEEEEPKEKVEEPEAETQEPEEEEEEPKEKVEEPEAETHEPEEEEEEPKEKVEEPEAETEEPQAETEEPQAETEEPEEQTTQSETTPAVEDLKFTLFGPVIGQVTINGIDYVKIEAGGMTTLFDLNYLYTFGTIVRSKRSLPQAVEDEIYKKAMIGDIPYRQFVHAHTVLDYEDAIFTENVKPILIKHLIKVNADGSEYQRFYVGDLDLENEAILLPEDQQPKRECPMCACEQCPMCACEKCAECAECVQDTTVAANETTLPANETTVPANETTVPANDTTVPANDRTVPANDTTVPANDTIVAANETTVPANGTTVPANDKTVPANNTTVPAKTSTESPKPTSPKTTTPRIALENDSVTSKDNLASEVDTATPIPCDESKSMPKNKKHLKNNGRKHRQSTSIRGKAPKSQPRGSKYLRTPISPKMAPIDC